MSCPSRHGLFCTGYWRFKSRVDRLVVNNGNINVPYYRSFARGSIGEQWIPFQRAGNDGRVSMPLRRMVPPLVWLSKEKSFSSPTTWLTSSNGNIFRATGPFCGGFTGHRWIHLTEANDAEPWCFLWSAPWINGWVNNREAVIWDAIALIIVMNAYQKYGITFIWSRDYTK